MEEWKDVEGWEGVYQISSHGRLKSFKGCPSGRVLSNKNKTGDYFSVVLRRGRRGIRQSARIHQLVAAAFLKKPLNKTEINHKDGNKQNNRADNLEWVTRRENMLHARKHNPLIVEGMRLYNRYIRPKPVGQFSLTGELISVFNNCAEAGSLTGVCSRNIHQVAAQTEYKPGMVRRQAGGYKWGFCEVADIA
ncbi:MAG: NUMOD4 motif-containing HNH endonuclease [Bacilli bacterium]